MLVSALCLHSDQATTRDTCTLRVAVFYQNVFHLSKVQYNLSFGSRLGLEPTVQWLIFSRVHVYLR